MALQEAKRRGAIEAVYVDEQRDVVFEGTTSNVFIVKNGKIVTPRTDILPGITRKVILGICLKDLDLTEADVSIADLFTADEVFLTASNKEVMPVTKIDGSVVGNRNVGASGISKKSARFLRFTTTIFPKS